jgi:hypothetical protein
VIKDGFSERPAGADHLDRNSNDQLLGSPVGSVTQELAQLLAALVAQNAAFTAQNQANRSGAPTNAELTSLGNLVSAAAARLTIAPASKEGISTLSYTQPAAAPPHELGHDDEPMPIPSTWRKPLARDDDRWFHQQMCATVLGLIAGLMIVVPAVLWLSGFFSPQRSETTATRAVPTAADARTAPEAKFADVKTVPVDPVRSAEQSPESEAQLVKGNVEQPSPAPVEAEPPPLVPIIATARLIGPNQARIDGLLSQAAERIESGDVTGAREMLADADDGVQGAVSFALAETYDPNMLAAWGARGGDADAAKARALYQKAFGLGVARAQNRLDALRP